MLSTPIILADFGSILGFLINGEYVDVLSRHATGDKFCTDVSGYLLVALNYLERNMAEILGALLSSACHKSGNEEQKFDRIILEVYAFLQKNAQK